MKIERDWIQAHIPHQGTMCLLQAVEHWTTESILCSAISHTALDNPLRNATGLPIIAGIEYAAQSMAIHGALLSGAEAPPTIGYLTHVRNVHWYVSRLDPMDAQLRIAANRISGNAIGLLYDFSIHCEDQLLMRGRAGVMTRPQILADAPESL